MAGPWWSARPVLVDGQLRSDADPLPPEVDNRFPSTNSDHQPVLDRMIIQFLFSIILNPVLDNPRSIVVIKRFMIIIGYYKPIFFHQSTGIKDKMLKLYYNTCWNDPRSKFQLMSSKKRWFLKLPLCGIAVVSQPKTLRLRLDRILSTWPFRNSFGMGIPLKNPVQWFPTMCMACMAFDCCITLW